MGILDKINATPGPKFLVKESTTDEFSEVARGAHTIACTFHLKDEV